MNKSKNRIRNREHNMNSRNENKERKVNTEKVILTVIVLCTKDTPIGRLRASTDSIMETTTTTIDTTMMIHTSIPKD